MKNSIKPVIFKLGGWGKWLWNGFNPYFKLGKENRVLKKMMHLVLAGIENINSDLNGMEWLFQSGRNGMTSFHSGRNDHSNQAGMIIPIRPEGNDLILSQQEWSAHSILLGMEWNELFILARME